MTRKKTKRAKPPVADAPEDERPQVPNFKDHLLAIPRDDGTFERMDVKLRDVEF